MTFFNDQLHLLIFDRNNHAIESEKIIDVSKDKNIEKNVLDK